MRLFAIKFFILFFKKPIFLSLFHWEFSSKIMNLTKLQFIGQHNGADFSFTIRLEDSELFHF